MKKIIKTATLMAIFLVSGFYWFAFEGRAQSLAFIQGTVRDAVTNDPIPGVFVDAFEVNFGYVSTGSVNTTNSNGEYSFMVFEGIYKVFFRGSGGYVGQWWDTAGSFSGGSPVVAAGGNTIAGVNALMATTGGGGISGRVTGPAGAPVANVSVTLYDYGQQVTGKRGIAVTTTDGNGDYTIANLPAGQYKLYFRDLNAGNNNLAEWWNNKTVITSADPFPVWDWAVTNVHCQLSAGGVITGTVRDGSSTPINGAFAYAYDQNYKYIASASTDSGGNYALSNMPTGNYMVRFQGPFGSNLALKWYDNQSFFNVANGVSVTAGETTSNINAQLLTGGSISGSISSGGSGVFTGVEVFDEYKRSVAGGSSSSDGLFSIPGLPSGRYKVKCGGGNQGIMWYSNQRTYDLADWVQVTSGQNTSDINCQLSSPVTVSGRVTNSGGEGIPRVAIRIYDSASQKEAWRGISTSTNSLGKYSVMSLSPGPSKILFDSRGTGYFPEWWDDAKSINGATDIDLVSGQTYLDKDAVLGLSHDLYLPLMIRD